MQRFVLHGHQRIGYVLRRDIDDERILVVRAYCGHHHAGVEQAVVIALERLVDARIFLGREACGDVEAYLVALAPQAADIEERARAALCK